MCCRSNPDPDPDPDPECDPDCGSAPAPDPDPAPTPVTSSSLLLSLSWSLSPWYTMMGRRSMLARQNTWKAVRCFDGCFTTSTCRGRTYAGAGDRDRDKVREGLGTWTGLGTWLQG